MLCLGTTRLNASPRNRLSGCIRAWSPARPSRCVHAREAGAVANASLLTAISPPAGDGASVRAGAAAGLHSEKLRGRGGGPDGQTDPQRSPRLQSRKYACVLLNPAAALLAYVNGSFRPVVVPVFLRSSCIHLCASWPTCCRWTDRSSSVWTLWPEN